MSRLLSLLFHDVYAATPAESGFSGAAADRYKLSVNAFDNQLSSIVESRNDRPILVGKGETTGFAITVDDGGIAYYAHVADHLEARGWRGHCFVTTGAIGRRGFLDAPQIRELRARGHLIGSHSVTHPLRFSALSATDMLREWNDSRHRLADILGEDVVAASIPGGSFSPNVARTAHDAGFRYLFTSEPRITVSNVDGCEVLGRFTIRSDSRPDRAGQLAGLHSTARFHEWVVWNGKKQLKLLLASASRRAAAPRRLLDPVS